MGTLSAAHFRSILGDSDGPSVYIETGLWKGNQLAIASKVFDVCYGIELAPHWAQVNRDRFNGMDRVTIFEGDSAKVLPKVLADLRQPVVINLDAHFCKTDPPVAKSKFPLWSELAYVTERPYADIILVDDIHTFGRRREDLRFSKGDEEWEAVRPRRLVRELGRVERHEAVDDSYVLWRSALPEESAAGVRGPDAS